MELIQNLIQFSKDHWVEVLAVIGAVDIILGIIVKATKAEWDNNLYAQVHNFIVKLTQKKPETPS